MLKNIRTQNNKIKQRSYITFEKSPSIQIQNSNLSCETVVKLLGIDIDYQLNFDLHISNLYRKASPNSNSVAIKKENMLRIINDGKTLK
jgi:hypothetical protein